MKKLLYFIFAVSVSLQSCIGFNAALSPTGYEPCMLEKKGDSRLNISTVPYLLKVNYCRAISDKTGISISSAYFNVGGFADAGYIRYVNKQKYNMDFCGGFYFESNQSHYSTGNALWSTIFTDRNFSMLYYAPYIASSFVSKGKKLGVGWSEKIAWNFVGKYYYNFEKDPYLGSDVGPNPLDKEIFLKNLNPFFSLESGMHLYFNYNSRNSLKLQLGYTAVFHTYYHTYSFYQDITNYIITRTNGHPTVHPVYFNICWVKKLGKKEKKS